jgi:hypothetical protein
MRLVKQIPHERYLIQIHHYNGKFILKIELGGYEQLFKIAESEVDIEKLEINLSDVFLKNCFDRFLSMRSDWEDLVFN